MASSESNPTTDLELLERGRLTLQSIRFREQAARYQAEATALQAALVKAENGDTSLLQDMLARAEASLPNNTRLVFEEDSIDDLSDQATQAHWESSPSLAQASPTTTPSPISPTAYTSSPNVSSPWSMMEEAARLRFQRRNILATSNAYGDASKPFATEPNSSGNDSNDDKVLASVWTREATTQVASEPAPEGSQEDEVPEELLAAISKLEEQPQEHRGHPWWAAAHIWVSLIMHVGMVIGLSIIVITAAQKPQPMSIVSATVEADNVLMETPLEMVSDLETNAEPTAAEALPNVSDLVADVSLPTIPMETGTIPAIPASATSSIAGTVANAESMSGSKMVAGAEFFGVKAVGNTFVYIVDSSPSMRKDGAFDAAKQELIRSLSSMQPKQRYFISFFGKEIDPMVFQTGVIEKYPVNAKPENLRKTLDWLSRVQIQKEGLPPNDALAAAIAMQPDGIFMLFDGDTKVDVVKYLRKVNRSADILSSGTPKVPIHVVHFYQEEFQKQMKQIADENSGTYRFIPRPERTTKGKR